MYLPVHFRTPWRCPSVWSYHYLCYSTALFLIVCSIVVEGAHLFFTSTKRDYSLGAWAIRNTGLTLLLNHFQSAHSKKNVLNNLFSPLFPRYGVGLILILPFQFFNPFIHASVYFFRHLSVDLNLKSIRHCTEALRTQKCQDLPFAVLYDKDR